MRKSIDLVNQVDDTAASAETVFEAIHHVMHLYRGQQYQGSASGLTHLEGKVLGFFARHPGATQKDLAQRSGRDKGQLARLVGTLREQGLLEATIDEADRRNIRLQISAEARALLQKIERQSRRTAEAAVAGMSTEERRQLVALLGRIAGNLGAQR